jgi:WD40 repeat protein
MPGVSEALPGGKTELACLWTAHASDYVTSLAWSSDGALCAAGAASGDALVLGGADGALQARIAAHTGGVLAVAWSPTARLLATAGQDGTARIHRDDGALVATLPGATRAWVEHLAWSPDGKQLATSSGKVVRIWTAEGNPYLETGEHPSTVTGLAWNRRGSQLATTCYGGVHIWRFESGASSRELSWRGSLISLAWSPDDKVIACGSQDCSVHFWRLSTGQDSAMQGYPSKPKVLVWDADSTLLATSGGPTVTVWRFSGRGPEGTKPILLEGHDAPITSLAFAPKRGLLASGAEDTEILLWGPRRGERPLGRALLDDAVSAVTWRPRHPQITGADASGRVSSWAVP